MIKEAELGKQGAAYQAWCRENPKQWIQETLGVKHWWPGMDEMIEGWKRGIRERKPIVVGSGHALSKDFLNSGCLPLWFTNAYGPKCKVAMTAPTDRQVKKVMWNELTARYEDSPLKTTFGRLLVCNLELSPEWFVLAFTTKETGGAVGKFQGFHTPAICVIMSEAQAVSDEIYEQIDGIMTSDVALFVVLGNPVRTSGHYVRMLKDTKNNIVINLSCLESPNYHAKKTVIPGVCPYEWVQDKERRWNKDGTGKDPRWQGRVLGIVPDTAIDTIISHLAYEQCVGRDLFPKHRRGSIGVDPARFGDDDMVIVVKESGETIAKYRYSFCDAVKGASYIIQAQKRHFPEGQVAIVVDCDGIGGPFLDNAKRMAADELDIVWVNYNGSSSNKEIVSEEYQNIRAEAHFHQKTEMEEGRVSLSDDDELAYEEATETKYFYNLRGKIQIESKDDIKERLGRSPNDWDAEVMATWGLKFAPVIKPRDKWRDRRGSSMVHRTNVGMGA